jgi:hypothetical protein
MPSSNPAVDDSVVANSALPTLPSPATASSATSKAPAASQSATQPRRTFKQVLLSYFYWTYSRGSFHYDVMVTLILLFIFVTPHIHGWSFGDTPSTAAALAHPIQIVSDGGRGMILTVEASDANVPAGISDAAVKRALRKAIEPVTGDAVFVEKWQTVTDAQGNAAWKVWAHR